MQKQLDKRAAVSAPELYCSPPPFEMFWIHICCSLVIDFYIQSMDFDLQVLDNGENLKILFYVIVVTHPGGKLLKVHLPFLKV